MDGASEPEVERDEESVS
jgi:hypothetical protein